MREWEIKERLNVKDLGLCDTFSASKRQGMEADGSTFSPSEKPLSPGILRDTHLARYCAPMTRRLCAFYLSRVCSLTI